MFPPTVIPALNVFKRGQLGLLTCFKINVVNHLALQRFEKALGHGIVPTITLSTGFVAWLC